MSEKPRLSRRELREQGKLEALPKEVPSPYDTSELRLRRPTRKELRELAEQETVEQRAVSDPVEDEAGRPTPLDSEPIHHERKSVFDRFTDHKDDADTTASAAEADADGVEQHDDSDSEPDTADATNAGETAGADEDKSAAETTPAASDAPETGAGDVSLRDRFLAMTKRDEELADPQATEAFAMNTAPETSDAADSATTPATPEAGVEEEAEEASAASEDEEASTDVEIESPRRMWLRYIVLILIAAIIGYLGGSWINVTFLSEPLPDVLISINHLLL